MSIFASLFKEERRRDTRLVDEEATLSGDWFSISSEKIGCGGLLLGVSTLLCPSSSSLALAGDFDFLLPTDDRLLLTGPSVKEK